MHCILFLRVYVRQSCMHENRRGTAATKLRGHKHILIQLYWTCIKMYLCSVFGRAAKMHLCAAKPHVQMQLRQNRNKNMPISIHLDTALFIF
jgi:hypothetical protein